MSEAFFAAARGQGGIVASNAIIVRQTSRLQVATNLLTHCNQDDGQTATAMRACGQLEMIINKHNSGFDDGIRPPEAKTGVLQVALFKCVHNDDCALSWQMRR